MRIKTLALVCAACGWAAAPQAGQVVYDNLGPPAVNPADGSQYFIGGFGYDEVGDDMVLLQPGLRVFEWAKVAYTGAAFDGNETMTMSLYMMDGAPTPGSFGFPTPGTSIYSQTVPIGAGASNLAMFADASGTVILPDVVGMGLTFGGIDGAETFGPLLFDPPTVGSSFFDYWLRGVPVSGGPWGLYSFGGNPNVNLGVQITAVPEASTWVSLVGLSGLVGAVAWRRLRRAR